METLKIRDKRNKGWFFMDNEYLNGMGRHMGPIGIAVYVSLCRHANNEQQCFPSQELIAEEINVSRQTVVKYINLLEKHRVVQIDRTVDEETRQKRNNIYTLLDKSLWIYPSRVKEIDKDSRVKLTAEPCQTGNKSRVKQFDNKDTNINNTNITILSNLIFDKFWSKYPNKTNKKKAREIWQSKCLDGKIDEILDFIEKAKETDRWDKGYIKAPDVFLRNENWTDDIKAYGDVRSKITII